MDNVGDGIVLFVNNKMGYEVTRWLLERDESVRLAIVHPPARAKYGKEIQDVCTNHNVETVIWDKNKLAEMEQKIADSEADFGISSFFAYIIPESIITIFKKGIINLHPAYLPFNKGRFPNIWSIVEDTPAGVTIHFIDPGVDTGDIILQRKVETDFSDTGETLYRRLEKERLDLFVETWQDIKQGRFERKKQLQGGTSHKGRDVKEIDNIEPQKMYTAKKLIDILRARTFAGHESAYMIIDGKKYFIRVSIEKEQ